MRGAGTGGRPPARPARMLVLGLCMPIAVLGSLTQEPLGHRPPAPRFLLLLAMNCSILSE